MADNMSVAPGQSVEDNERLAATMQQNMAQWQAAMAAMAQAQAQGKPGSSNPFGSVPFPMPFGQPFAFPTSLLYGVPGLPGLGELPTVEGAGTAGTKTDDSGDDEGGGADSGRGKQRAGGALGSAPLPKKPKAEGQGAPGAAGTVGLGVKSNSDAALAMLASAAAVRNPPGQGAAIMAGAAPKSDAAAAGPAAVVAAGLPAMSNAGMAELWSTFPGQAAAMAASVAAAVAAGAGGALPELPRVASDGALDGEGEGDDRETKRMRRKQSNRESARRSRLRKQAECEQLGKTVEVLQAENSRLREEKMQLLAQVEILTAKLSMSSAFGAVQQALTHGSEGDKLAPPGATGRP